MHTKTRETSVLFILALCSFFVGLDSIITVPLLPTIAQSTTISLDLGALFVTSYACMYMISAPFFGAVSDRLGRKNMMLVGMLVLAIGTLVTGFGRSFSDLLIFRAITGLGAGILQPSMFAYLGDNIPYEQRGRAMGIVMGALVGSTLIGVPLGTYFAHIGSWRWTCCGIGLLALITILLIQKGIPYDTPSHKEKATDPFRSMISQFRSAFFNRSIFFSLLATFLWFGGLQGMFANVGVYYNLNFGLDENQIGLVLMIAGLGSVIGTVIGGKLADKRGKKVVIGFACIFTAAGVLGISVANENMVLALVIHVLWSTSFGFGHAALNALISELDPTMRGTVISLNSSVMYAGMMFATAVSAVLLHGRSFLPIGLLCAAATLLVLPITVLLMKETKKTKSSTPIR